MADNRRRGSSGNYDDFDWDEYDRITSSSGDSVYSRRRRLEQERNAQKPKRNTSSGSSQTTKNQTNN